VSGLPADVNHDDVHFARLMAPHHDQAVSMCEMVLSKEQGVQPEVRDPAEQIRKVRASQLQTLDGWVQSWDPSGHLEPTEDANAPHHGGHGLMSEGQMRDLDLADGPAGQRRVSMEGPNARSPERGWPNERPGPSAPEPIPISPGDSRWCGS
jgi:uncharacterized protein (DUF305 family)